MITLIAHKQHNLFDLYLEKELMDAELDYDVSRENKYGLELPLLVVDGVPLDMERAMKYIKESSHNE